MIILENTFINRIAVIVIAVIMDLLIGDPHFLWHPVQGIGSIISGTEKFLRRRLRIAEEREADKEKKRMAGLLLVIVVITASIVIPAVVLYIAGMLNSWISFGIECIMCYQLLAMRSLQVESMKVYKALQAGDVEKARFAVSMIVGRDTEKLDDKGITRAAVETVAENTSDGVVAPLIFMLIFGVLGGFAYKSVNTMDSMIGYKNDRYIYFGTAAAKLDDIVNFIPARIAALFMVMASCILGLNAGNAWNIFRRDRYKHESPNSAQTEAAMAGALSVQLAGNAYYFGKLHEKQTIGDSIRDIETEDIKRANNLMYATSLLVCVSGVVCLLLLFVLFKTLH